ncbi:MAG: HNH endonuclease [Bacteroidetes bacterium]|nr:MAG: HNH endonuclease [Bacteroidota bacterium]
MSRYVSVKERQIIGERASYCCEYCQLPETDSYYGFQADHIISWRHGGITHVENLAYACPDCNRNKGADVGTILQDANVFVRFYNPRRDSWSDHFDLQYSGAILPKSDIGLATVKILDMNHPDRVIERALLIRIAIMKPSSTENKG